MAQQTESPLGDLGVGGLLAYKDLEHLYRIQVPVPAPQEPMSLVLSSLFEPGVWASRSQFSQAPHCAIFLFSPALSDSGVQDQASSYLRDPRLTVPSFLRPRSPCSPPISQGQLNSHCRLNVIAVSLPVGRAWLQALQTKVAPSSWLEGVRNSMLSTNPVVPSFSSVWRVRIIIL